MGIPDVEPTGGSARSRRGFLKAVAVGGAAAAAAPLLGKLEPAVAAPPPPGPLRPVGEVCQPLPVPPYTYCVGYYESDIGQITVGGMLVTYASAPLNARGSLTFSMSNTRTETIRATSEFGTQIAASATISRSITSDGGSKFTVAGGVERTQAQSTRVTTAITHSSTATQTIQTAPVAAGAYNAWEHTAFLIMARPVLTISAFYSGGTYPRQTPVQPVTWPNGAPILRYRFADGGTIFPRSARELRDDPGTRDFLGAETADAILAQFPLRPGQTSGGQLSGSRFALVAEISPGEVPFTFVRSMTGTSTVSAEQSTSVTTRITAGFSRMVTDAETIDFQTNRSFTFSHSSVQEVADTQVISTTGVLSSDLNHRNRIYEDRVWNTLLITDEGPLAGAFDAVSGTVTAADGSPINGAAVSMTVGGASHETFTGQDGQYTLRLGEHVEPGEYEVTCAGVSRTVAISRGAKSTANYSRVNARLAGARTR